MRRKLLLLCILIGTLNMYSQNLQKSIWGCKLGCNRETVEQAIRKQGLEQELSLGGKIKISDLEFSGRYFDYAIFSFYLDQLHTCEFHVNLKSDEETKSYVSIFRNKYGRPKRIDSNKIYYYDDLKNSIIFQGVDKKFMLVFWNDEILRKSVKGE